MSKIVEMLGLDIPTVIYIVAFIIALAVLYFLGKKETVKELLYSFVCRAEQQFGSGTGGIKLAYVWELVYTKLPLLVRIIFPKKTLEKYIELGVTRLKNFLNQSNANLLTLAQEQQMLICEPDPSFYSGGIEPKDYKAELESYVGGKE